MKKFLFLLVLFAAPAAFAQTQGFWSQSQALTGTAPSAVCTGGASASNANCGLSLVGLSSAQICLKADAGGNFTGGTLLVYWYDPKDSTWKPSTQFNLTVPTTTGPNYCWPAFNVFPVGRVYVVTSAVTLSAGAAVTPSVRGVSK